MAKGKRRRKNYKKISWVQIVAVSVLFSCAVLISINEYTGGKLNFIPTWDELTELAASYGKGDEPVVKKPTKAEGEIQVHILDVGQADSILIKTDDKTVLIDAGENENAVDVYKYLMAHDVEKIDILIGSHPHSDHIGGLDYIIEKLPVDTIIMPKIPDEIVPTTKTYTDVLTIILEQGKKITQPIVNKTYDLGGGASLTLLAPNAEYSDLNNMSIVSRLDFGEASFLFTGDSSKEAENDIMRLGLDVDVDILSVAHHGSNSSSTDTYLEKIAPMLSVISVGIDNSYGHPHKEVIKRLSAYGEIYQTSVMGDIIFTTDGKTINITTEKISDANIILNAA